MNQWKTYVVGKYHSVNLLVYCTLWIGILYINIIKSFDIPYHIIQYIYDINNDIKKIKEKFIHKNLIIIYESNLNNE
jgi:hypothetical protein